MRILRIAGFARALPHHSLGGMQVVSWDIFTELANRGHEVTVFTTSIPGQSKAFHDSGVNVLALDGTKSERYSSEWWRKSALEFEKRADKFDALLSVSSAASAACDQPAARSIPKFFQAHGTSFGEIQSKWASPGIVPKLKSAKNAYWLMRDGFIYRKFDSIIAVSPKVEAQLRNSPTGWFTRDMPIQTISNGIDTRRFHPGSVEDSGRPGPVIVFAARLHAEKGGTTAVRTLKVLRSHHFPDARLIVVGDGPDRKNMERMARQLGLETHIHFEGEQPREMIPQLLRSADSFIFPTRRQEGLPTNVLEALACGLTPVCSDSVRDSFDVPVVAKYAPMDDPAAFAAAIAESLLERRASASLLPAKYSLERCVDSYVDMLEEFI